MVTMFAQGALQKNEELGNVDLSLSRTSSK
jgi:hypothetical protein